VATGLCDGLSKIRFDLVGVAPTPSLSGFKERMIGSAVLMEPLGGVLSPGFDLTPLEEYAASQT
jgi:hypothetical protein